MLQGKATNISFPGGYPFSTQPLLLPLLFQVSPAVYALRASRPPARLGRYSSKLRGGSEDWQVANLMTDQWEWHIYLHSLQLT